MEFVPGITLKGLMDKVNAPLDEMYAAHVVKQVVIGLEHATKEKIIHRDIKPANILLTSPVRLPDDEKPACGKMDDAAPGQALPPKKIDAGRPVGRAE